MSECAFEGCGRQRKAKGLCISHWRQQHQGSELTPLKPYKRFARPAPGKKICTRCERVLRDPEDFYKRANGSIQSWCKKCMTELASARFAAKQAAKEAAS